MVSLRRIEKYMNGGEVDPVPPIEHQSDTMAFQSCTVTWSQDRSLASASATPSAASTPRHKFMLMDMNLAFPPGELSLICGKLGSGKTLLLLCTLPRFRSFTQYLHQTRYSFVRRIRRPHWTGHQPAFPS